jgi:DNA repair protein RadA/Sms
MVRPVAQAAARLKEAQKLGFARAFAPDTARNEGGDGGMALTTVGPLVDMVGEIAPKGTDPRRAAGAGEE